MIAGLVLAALLLAGGATLLRPARPVAIVTAALSAVWLSVNNGELEGPTLLTLSASRGVTAADLVAVAGAGLAGIAVLRWRIAADGRSEAGRKSAGGSAETRDRAAAVCLIAIAIIMVGGVGLNVAYQ